MIVPSIDRTPVSMKVAFRQLIRCATSKRLGLKDIRLLWPNCPPSFPSTQRALIVAAREALLIPLQDGMLTATGRLSRRPADPREERHRGRTWVLHSSRQSAIPIKAWRKGRYDWRRDALELADCHYIEIQLLKVLVEALWPDFDAIDATRAEAQAAALTVYSTPYLELMRQAIEAFKIDTGGRPKKEVLVDWFRQQEVAGQPVSGIMARYLATFIRQPETQRGGNRKWSQGATPT